MALLVSSISTINGAKAKGEPDGTRWASVLAGVLIEDINIWPTHRGRAKLTQNTRCLELVNTYGSSPNVLVQTRKRINAMQIVRLPGAELAMIAENSPHTAETPLLSLIE